MSENEKINTVLTRGVNSILPSEKDLRKLIGDRKIKLYLGVDATGSQLHLGHTIPLRKLIEFSDHGHEAVLVFGTGTVLVGDPSERETGRKLISEEEVNQNIKNWKEQVAPLVDFSKVKIVENGDWLKPLKLKDLVDISSNISAIQLFKRDTFQKRIKKGDTVWYHETLYPILQGYDSVVLDVDLEIGGTDQEFNMLIGRELQKKMNKRDKFVLTTPMIMGVDGKQMSKTSGNCVWLNDKPNDMYGKLMKIPDNQIIPYMELVTDIPLEKVEKHKEDIKSGNLSQIDGKKKLAYAVVNQLHNKNAADEAEKYFEKTFQKRSADYEDSVTLGKNLAETVANAGNVSVSEAKRLISSGSVDLNDNTITDPTHIPASGDKMKIGKKKFVRIA